MINNKMWDDITKHTKTCNCGHRILFKAQTKRIICSWCGNWCYQNKADEFKDKLNLQRRKIDDKKK